MTKEHLKQLIRECLERYGPERTTALADAIKQLGFRYATRSGISFSITDVIVPSAKKNLLAIADRQVEELRAAWHSGLITREELRQRTITIWQHTTNQVTDEIQKVLDPYGTVATIASSGATKARLQQIRQLSGMRGLMASPTGDIVETAVRGNFLEGLNVAEYFMSSHGARKSLMDRSLNTAEAGYLTSRFVNVAQDVFVTEVDCGSTAGLLILDTESKEMGLSDSRSRLIGRVLAEALPQCNLAAGDILDEQAIDRILAAHLPAVRVRSVLACRAQRGVCSKCYGWDLSTHALVRLGTAVGVLAAQSIGEPGTQLTMRTFHSGGIAGGQGDITQGLPRVEELFEARVPRDQALVSEIEGQIILAEQNRIIIRSDNEEAHTYHIPQGRKVIVSMGQQVRAGDPLTDGPLNLQDLLRYQGREILERYILKEAQRVYRTTGAYIHDKHFEIIIRQMVRRVQVDDPGDSTLLPGDLLDRLACINLNARILAEGGHPVLAHEILLGLTRAALETESWLAAASFQQTSRILSEAALAGRVDYLIGLKENVIVGNRIPAGTGILPRPPRSTSRNKRRVNRNFF